MYIILHVVIELNNDTLLFWMYKSKKIIYTMTHAYYLFSWLQWDLNYCSSFYILSFIWLWTQLYLCFLQCTVFLQSQNQTFILLDVHYTFVEWITCIYNLVLKRLIFDIKTNVKSECKCFSKYISKYILLF